jgi:hypothetical protein
MDANAVLWAELYQRGITNLGQLSDDEVPSGAFPSGVYAGISRVGFPGYSEAASSERKAVAPLPCQECLNTLPYCECE